MRLNLYIEFLVVAGLVVVCGLAAFQRNFIWKDDLALWKDVVEKSPNKARAHNAIGHNNLGLCFLAKGPIDQAIEEFKLAIKTKPLDGMWHVNLGIAYWKKGLHELANKEIGLGKPLRRRHKTRIVENSEGYRR